MAQWRKVVVSGSTAELNNISASGNIVPVTTDGSSLGSGLLGFSDLYLDSGAVINLDGGDVTLTHASNEVQVDGGDLVIEGTNKIGFGGAPSTDYIQKDTDVKIVAAADIVLDPAGNNIKPASNDDAALGVSGTAFSDLFLADAGVIDFNAGNTTITGGSSLVNINTPVRGTKLEIDSAADYLDVDTDLKIIAAADVVVDPGGGELKVDGNVVPNSDSADSLGASGTAWLKLWVDDIDLAGQGSISMGGTAGRIDLDTDDDTSIRSAADDVITFEAGAVDILEINATSISGSSISTGSFGTLRAVGKKSVNIDNVGTVSGSSISTGSFGRVEATTLVGDGAGITGLTSAAIDTVAAMTNNYVITATAGTAVTGEANLQFDGTDLLVGGGGKVAFRDNGGEYIYSVSDNVLGLAAGSEIDLTATTIDINGLVDISGNLTVGGNLDVNGTVTTIDTVNLLISESFATYASGSTTAVDGGFGVQYHLDGRARSYGWDASATRWSFQNDLNVTGSIISPDAYVATVETGTGDGDSQGNPTYGGATGYGNIYVDTDDGEIWIFA